MFNVLSLKDYANIAPKEQPPWKLSGKKDQ